MEKIELRAAREAERSLVVGMVRSEHLNPFGLDWRRFLLAVAADGSVAGCAQIKSHGDGTRELASLVVRPAWRGRGLARQLIEALMAGQEPPLYLMCSSSLETLYARFGFRPLAQVEMPPYYRRIYALFSLARRLRPSAGSLSIMCWAKK